MEREYQKPDSLIFDMDGTLWDAVGMYQEIWNRALRAQNIQRTVSREELMQYMGKSIFVIIDGLFPELSKEEAEAFLEEIQRQNIAIVPEMKADIYPGVQEGLARLKEKYPLFLLSNCEKDGLVNFMNYSKTHELIVDYMEHGQNLMPKCHNIQLLAQKHGLKSPMYVGDTDSDSKEAQTAGVPFVFVTYGFGKTDNYQLKFDSFPELVDYFMNL